MKYFFLKSFLLMISILLVTSFMHKNRATISEVSNKGDLKVSEILLALGDEALPHYQDNYDAELAEVGETLIKKGKANYKEHKGKRISSYFQCTDCHSLTRDANKLTNVSPDDRLAYSKENNTPFYPGSTLFGIYNRSSFYNDDYDKKYGDLVYDARDSLGNAIQLCAEYCASGRLLEDWELNAILHYFKREELRLSDLDLKPEDYQRIIQSVETGGKEKESINILKGKYTTGYKATFTGALDEDKREYGATGDPERGELLYETSCMHCHNNARVTYLNLDKDILSAQYLWNNKEGYDDESIYQVIRWGTYPITGRKQYMPLYTKERMTDLQIEDLMAYIKLIAKK